MNTTNIHLHACCLKFVARTSGVPSRPSQHHECWGAGVDGGKALGAISRSSCITVATWPRIILPPNFVTSLVFFLLYLVLFNVFAAMELLIIWRYQNEHEVPVLYWLHEGRFIRAWRGTRLLLDPRSFYRQRLERRIVIVWD